MLQPPSKVKSGSGIYAIQVPSGRMGPMLPSNAYLYAVPGITPKVGDLAILFDEDYEKLTPNTHTSARVVMLKEEKNGSLVGIQVHPEEKIQIKNTKNRLHKVVQIICE
jgi:hypothetical protein